MPPNSGYFADPDGYYWEVAFGENWQFDQNDMLVIEWTPAFKKLRVDSNGGETVEFLAFLAPIAFVFALSALNQINILRKQVEQLQAEIDKLKEKI